MFPLRSVTAIGLPTRTGLGPRRSTRAGVDAVGAGVGALVVGGIVDANVGAGIGAAVDATGAVAGVLIVLAGDKSSFVHADAAAAMSTAIATGPMTRPALATPTALANLG